ncbi:hypothetical protein [Synechococcus sp. MIT S9508]|uniref:hypothetical protein n=1 Tax=Synechococcus sp. MIT S9508 TaxID=1801629 RepID=UPI0012E7C417|nr:hypothetical protein [Synechococcus sp. MIT S9508]
MNSFIDPHTNKKEEEAFASHSIKTHHRRLCYPKHSRRQTTEGVNTEKNLGKANQPKPFRLATQKQPVAREDESKLSMPDKDAQENKGKTSKQLASLAFSKKNPTRLRGRDQGAQHQASH